MIVPTIARLIIREHKHKPMQGKVLTLGRQTIGMTYEEVIELFQQEGLTPINNSTKNIDEIDTKTRVGKGTEYITDKLFFSLLGINNLVTMDVSNYENAEIIHNLNCPIPTELYEQFDFIIDGGTFDHIFDIKTAFENVVKMLKNDGRILQWNAASNFVGSAYISFGPDLFYDFYTINNFTDCKVCIAEVDSTGQRELWDFYEFDGDNLTSLQSNRIQMIVVIAEKGMSSTYNLIPIQSTYRDNEIKLPYEYKKRVIQQSSKRKFMSEKQCEYKLHTSPTNNTPNLYLERLKENGIIWCIKRFISINTTSKKESFHYIGKI